MSNIIVALDGFSSCGKSTTAKRVAAHLHYAFVDTGAMYRAVALYLHRNHIDISDIQAVEEALKRIEIGFEYNPARQASDTLLNGENVEQEIRKMYISELVSQVAAITVVRRAMVAQQQEMGKKKGIVMDGRDVGTVVFPNAEVKIFMTAQPHIRAQRRKLELLQKGEDLPLEEIIENLRMRDEIDSNRAEGPLKRAEDAIDLDTSFRSMDEQVDFVLAQVERVQREKNKPYLIVGQGIAGTVLAHHFIEAEIPFEVWDSPKHFKSSYAAGGIFNPVTGRKLEKTWLAEELFNYLFPFYQSLEKTLLASFFHPMPLFRPFANEEMKTWLIDRKAQINHDFLRWTEEGVWVNQAGWVDAAKLLDCSKAYFEDKGLYFVRTFEPTDSENFEAVIFVRVFMGAKILIVRDCHFCQRKGN